VIFAFIILGLFMLLVAARDVFVRGGKGSILLRCWCVSCHLSGFEVGLDIYLCDKSLRNKNLCAAKVNMSGRYLIGCDGDWAIVIADIPVENAVVCYYVKNRYSCRWQGYVDSVGRYDEGGRSRSTSRECMSWWEVGYD